MIRCRARIMERLPVGRTTLETQPGRAGVTAQVAEPTTRHGVYRMTWMDDTVPRPTNSIAAINRLPDISAELQSNAARGTTDASRERCKSAPRLYPHHLGRETMRNSAATRRWNLIGPVQQNPRHHKDVRLFLRRQGQSG